MYYKCLSCSYMWKSRKKIGTLLKCPKCNSKKTEHIPHDETGLLNKIFNRHRNHPK